MSNQICKALEKINKEIGDQYRICVIDYVPCLYRVFDNGFNVEITGFYSKSISLYLWYGEGIGSIMIKAIHNVKLNAACIDDEAGKLYEYSMCLISEGYNNREKIADLMYRGKRLEESS